MIQTDAAANLRSLLDRMGSRNGAVALLPTATEIVGRHPDDPRVQGLYLQILEKVDDPPVMTERWREFLGRWPRDEVGLRCAARQLIRSGRVDEGVDLVERQFELRRFDEEEWVSCANLLAAAEAHDRSDRLFARILASGSASTRTRIDFAKRLKMRGCFQEALDALRPVLTTLRHGSKARMMADELLELERDYPECFGHTGDMRPTLMVRFITELAAGRSDPKFPGVGRISLVTGTLGPGGAERQLSLLGVTLNELATRATRRAEIAEPTPLTFPTDVAPETLISSVEVLIRSLEATEGNAFFLPMLERAGVHTEQIEGGGPRSCIRADASSSCLPKLEQTLLRNLPTQVQWGLDHLAPILANRAYDSISIWQDGAALFAAPAALVAGIEKIQIMFRGLPPSIRQYTSKPEYEPLYRALSKVPGVSFAANSDVAAREYARWIGLQPGTVKVLHNCAPAMNLVRDESDLAMWEAFCARTSWADTTIGTVARFEPVKRPLDWIESAVAFRRLHENSRFIMVGDGRMRQQAERLAEAREIADRFLFVGHSSNLTYWYSKMSIFLLLSRFESLPNALIEAQLSGIPVVSTPAGGAAECFIDGTTGTLLECLESVDYSEVAASLKRSADRILSGEYQPEMAIDFASTKFSVASNVRRFFEII